MKSIITAILLFVSLAMAAQDKKSLEARANLLHDYTVTEQYEKLLDITYPKLFDLLPREKMVEVLKRMAKGDGFSIKIANTPPNFKFGEIKKIDGGSYSVVTYDLIMKMTFEQKMTAEEADMMVKSFKSNLKTDEVLFDAQGNVFTIKKRSQAVAVADKLTHNLWMFINNSDGPIKEKLLSDKVIKELNI